MRIKLKDKGVVKMQEGINNEREFKFSVELKESAKRERFIGSIKCRSDEINELKANLQAAIKAVNEVWQ